jgi:translation elongation factor P/translation initiation factor 5A
MRKIFLLITALLILTSLTSLVSAEIIIKQQPKEVYNLGDSVTIPVTIKTISGVSKIFEMSLLCQDIQREFYKNGINLGPGEEKTFESELVLTKEIIGELTGKCKIKGTLGEDYVITEEFEISNLINIQAPVEKVEFNPGESFTIKGTAQKKNGEDVNGFLDVQILAGENGSGDIKQLETIGNGFFSVNITFPETMKAGSYLVKLDAYELEGDGLTTRTNKGFMNYNILIKQVPTSLEIAFESSEVEPGTNLKVRTIMRDQTGERIEGGTSILTIKKPKNSISGDDEIAHQNLEVPMNEYYEFSIPYNEAPSEWKVVAVSKKITSEATFTIKENKEIEILMVNETLNIINIGNVPYQGIVFIKVGNSTLEPLNVSLEVDGVQKYKLSAREEGEYPLEIVADGEKKLETSIWLEKGAGITGGAIGIKEVKSNSKSLMRRPLAWIFMIMILGFVAFMIWKKGLKKSFFGKIKLKKKSKKTNKAWESKQELVRKPGEIVDSKNKAILSLSIKGEKHPAGIVCLKIKNLSEIQKTENNVKQTLNKVVAYAEAQKAVVYETQENIFFILNPTKTRTFKNEKPALEIAEQAVKEITNHNKLFNQKIEFGISLNYGNIVAKEDPKDKSLHFMSLGNLIASSKKLSTVSNGKILISGEMKEKLKEYAAFQEHKHPGITFYTIKQMKNSAEHAKFLSNFIKRMEQDQKAQKEKR